jgi:hypothetical protein
MRFPSQVHKEVNMMRRSLMLVIAVGLATLGSSLAWPEDSDQAAIIKALDGAKLTLLQGIAQVAKGTEVPIEAKYEMVGGKLMLSIYTSAKGFDTAAEDNSFNEYIGDVTTANWTPKKEVFADLKHIARSAQYHALLSMTKVRIPTIIQKGENSRRQARFRSDGGPRQYDQADVLRPRHRGADSRLKKAVGTQRTEGIANDDALLLRGVPRGDRDGVARTRSGILSGAEPLVAAARN